MLSGASQACQTWGLLPEGPAQSGDIAEIAQDQVCWNDRADRFAMLTTHDLGYYLPQTWENWWHPLQDGGICLSLSSRIKAL